MKRDLHILILEDVPSDAPSIRSVLLESGTVFTPISVKDEASYLKALDELSPDVIISDYSLPSFDGLSALKIARDKYPDVPFIFISGASDEEMAIDLLKQGATDYVPKNGLARLVFSVSRVLHEVKKRTELKVCEEDLEKREQALELKSRSLEEANAALQEANTALKVLLRHRGEDKAVLEEQLLANVQKLVLPYIENLKRLKLSKNQTAQVKIIEGNLQVIISPFLRNLTANYIDLTPRELQITTLIKEGKTSKEVADILNITKEAVSFHRMNLRTKLGITNKKANLVTFLSAFS